MLKEKKDIDQEEKKRGERSIEIGNRHGHPARRRRSFQDVCWLTKLCQTVLLMVVETSHGGDSFCDKVGLAGLSPAAGSAGRSRIVGETGTGHEGEHLLNGQGTTGNVVSGAGEGHLGLGEGRHGCLCV